MASSLHSILSDAAARDVGGSHLNLPNRSLTPEILSIDFLSTLSQEQLSSLVAHVQECIEDSQKDLEELELVQQNLDGSTHDVLLAKIDQVRALQTRMDNQSSHFTNTRSVMNATENKVNGESNNSLDTNIASHPNTPCPSPLTAPKPYKRTSPYLPSSVNEISSEPSESDAWETEDEVCVANGHVRRTSKPSISNKSSGKHTRTNASVHNGYSPNQVGSSPNRALLEDWEALETRNLELQDELEQVTGDAQRLRLAEQQRLRRLQYEVELLQSSLENAMENMRDLEAENQSLRQKSVSGKGGNGNDDIKAADGELISKLHSKVGELEEINKAITSNRDTLMHRLEIALTDLTRLKEQYDVLEDSSRDFIQLQQAFEKQEDYIEQLQSTLEEYRGNMAPYPTSPIGWEKRIGLYMHGNSRPNSAASMRSQGRRGSNAISDISVSNKGQPNTLPRIHIREATSHHRTPSTSTATTLNDAQQQTNNSHRSNRKVTSSRPRGSRIRSVILASPSRSVHMPRVINPKRTLLSELEKEWTRQAATKQCPIELVDDEIQSISSLCNDPLRRSNASSRQKVIKYPYSDPSNHIISYDANRNQSTDSFRSSLRHRHLRYPRLYDSENEDDDFEDYDEHEVSSSHVSEDPMSDFEFLQADGQMEMYYGGKPKTIIGRTIRYSLNWISWAMLWIQFLCVIGVAVVIAVYRGPTEVLVPKRITRK